MTYASRSLPTFSGALLGVSMLLLIHRNWGIDHDAMLYFGQALAQHEPGLFRDDLFFLHGSQARYTVFPWITGHLLAWIDPISLFFWGGLAGLLLFATCSWICLRELLPERQRYWAWLGVLTLPTFYGRAIIFSYAEPFLTPRPWAEGLCLLAIGLISRQRIGWALACLLLAGMLHPLPTIAAGLILWPWLILQDRRWLHLLWAGVPLLAAAGMSLAPLDGLLRPLDAEWLTQLRAINGQLFVTGWARQDYAIAVFDALVLGCGWKYIEPRFGRWCLAALLGLALGISASLVLVDGLHLELPTALQLWRVHWLAHWFAMAAMALLIRQAIIDHDSPQAILLGLTALLVWIGPAGVWLPFMALYMAWPKLALLLQPRARSLLGLLFGLGIGLLAIQFIGNEWLNFRLSGSRLDLYALDKRLIAFPLIAAGLPLLGGWLWYRSSPIPRALLTGLLLAVSLIAGLRWDIRAPLRRELDAFADTPGVFGVPIPADATVYWDNMSLLGTWSVLRRADYFDPQQLSGLAFNRGTVIESIARIRRLDPLMTDGENCREHPHSAGTRPDCTIRLGSLERACAPGNPAPPDFLVLPTRQSIRAIGSWTPRDLTTAAPLGQYWLYRCKDVIAALRQS